MTAAHWSCFARWLALFVSGRCSVVVLRSRVRVAKGDKPVGVMCQRLTLDTHDGQRLTEQTGTEVTHERTHTHHEMQNIHEV